MTHALSTLAALLILGAEPAADSTIRVDTAKVVNRISPLMYGSCIEDVNHEIYGGLYAQRVFGESFEEPPDGPGLQGLRTFGGEWSAKDGVLSVKADRGGKVVRDAKSLTDGVVSCEVRFADDRGTNAGLILRVQQPRTGPDTWVGYEVSLSARNQNVMLGRHRNDFHMLKEAPAKIEPGHWHKLRVVMDRATLRIFVDDAEAPAITFTDPEPIRAKSVGQVGVRTWESDASFRNLIVEEPGCVTTREAIVGLFDLKIGPWRLHKPRRRETVEVPFATDANAIGVVSGAWDSVRTGDAVAKLAWDDDRPFNGARSQRIELVGGEGTAGVANRGLNRWGIAVGKDATYEGRCYVRSDGTVKAATVALQSADGAKTYAKATLEEIGKDWAVCGIKLKSDETDPNARLALWIDEPGTLWVDQVYLADTDTFEGVPVRGDIARALKDQGLTALRYGGLMVNAPGYKWKTMIGDPDKRPPYQGYWYPYTTNGFGIEEFVRFCRAAEFEPIVAINVEETPEDAADLVDYLNGPVTTEWGRRRADNGHPEPYAVKYIELGNEEKTDAHYLERFKVLHNAMRPRDPKLNLIIAAWWEPDNPITRQIVRELEGKASLWDVHVDGDDPREGRKVDATFTRMEALVQEWAPGTSLKACVLEENGGHHDLARALGHAGILNATQRHGDFVLIDCPANCLQAWQQNDNGWDQGQLFYTPDRVWGMPPYYVQQMAARNHRPCRLASETKSPGDDLDVLATTDEDGRRLILKVVNTGDKAHRADIALEGPGQLNSSGQVDTIQGGLSDVNDTHGFPHRPSPDLLKLGSNPFAYEFPAHSYTILNLHWREIPKARRPDRGVVPKPPER